MRKRYMTRWTQIAALVLLAGTVGASTAGSGQAPPPALAGRWDATVVVNKVEVPFTFEIAGDGKSLAGSFFNGDRRVTSTSSELADEEVTVTCRGIGYGTSSIRTAEQVIAKAGWTAAESESVVVAHDEVGRRSRSLTADERARLDAAIETDG